MWPIISAPPTSATPSPTAPNKRSVSSSTSSACAPACGCSTWAAAPAGTRWPSPVAASMSSGIDISQTFIDLARANDTTARFERADARDLSFCDEFDAVISLCQGGFGLCGGVPGSPVDDDLRILRGMARAAKPGGLVAVSAFSAYFRVRYLDETVDFDAERGAYHEVMELRDLAGTRVEKDGWTTCFTPRELRLMFAAVGLDVEAQASVSPGDYARRPPDLDHYEYLTVGRRADPPVSESRPSE